ncbi:hypothetical protein ACUW9N_002173 [Staphylococcus auricularis]|uniref:hypothetical protein n=1 Tax=Staphylococcus auricularis TaxID=29379 RepID=UPI0019336B6C|nr:hypothetical protein [Staphylococcus auricularis]MBM0868915.1 hypothetical protein [Staphylococcus auricularis]MCG7342375.1 hypothetical protein [Staphylococcus auricularis]
MSIKIEGTHELIKKLEKKYGTSQVDKVTNTSLEKGAEYYEGQIKKNFETFKDTGASIKEVTHTELHFITGNVKQVLIHWKGSMNRYAIIHLNEWGTVKNPNPRGKGMLLKTERESRKPYLNIVREELRKHL